MNLGLFLDIESAIRSFFSSLSASISFDLIFFIGIALQLLLILIYVVKSRFSYEIRATKAFDRLNKWLFVNKKIGAENIKEFTNLVKKSPKRISYCWQQFILYREKHASEYLNVEDCIDKPLRTSSIGLNIRNLSIFSVVLSLLIFILGIAHNNVADAGLNASMIVVSLITPLLMLFLLVVSVALLSARKNFNLDSLYQNHHLFQRFIDNACVDLPQFIDFTLLFSVEEIEKGIPALREFLESRARKEKEEFDKARSEMIVYEKYDFEKAGVDGSNILERAMNESETFLNNKAKTLAKISQFEASLESLKRNFDNIQKDYQKKMQISKENIDRLRQQQEETTSRIESNFLRKQQATEIAKQEKEEADFEQQKRRYLVEKNDYEEEIKNLNNDLSSAKEVVERAMLSEYQTFYKRLCQSANENVDQILKDELSKTAEERDETEEELAQTQAVLKRLRDENNILRNKLSAAAEVKVETAVPVIEAENKEIEIKPKKEKKSKKEEKLESKPAFILEEPQVLKEEKETPKEEVKQEEVASEPEENFSMIDFMPVDEEVEPAQEVESKEEKVEEPELGETEIVDKKPSEKKRGRPRKPVSASVSTEPKKRGRPVGSTKKVNSPSVKKKAKAKTSTANKTGKRGRPSKNKTAQALNHEIDQQQSKLLSLQNNINNQLSQALDEINNSSRQDTERLKLIEEIEDLKQKAEVAQKTQNPGELEEINQKIETLLDEINRLEN